MRYVDGYVLPVPKKTSKPTAASTPDLARASFLLFSQESSGRLREKYPS
jgi:hypothetical protein